VIENISTGHFAISGAMFGFGDSIGRIAEPLMQELARRLLDDFKVNRDYELNNTYELNQRYRLDRRYELNHMQDLNHIQRLCRNSDAN